MIALPLAWTLLDLDFLSPCSSFGLLIVTLTYFTLACQRFSGQSHLCDAPHSILS